MTQKERILKELKTGRWFSTVDAVNLYILRLGAIIFDLKKDGYNIEERKVEGKNYSEYRIPPKITLPPPFKVEPKQPTTAHLL